MCNLLTKKLRVVRAIRWQGNYPLSNKLLSPKVQNHELR